MYPELDLILGFYKVIPSKILEYDRHMTEMLTRFKRPWKGCFPKRFFRRLEIQGECWVWTGPRNPRGHPRFAPVIHRKQVAASGRQLMWRWVGRDPVPSTTVSCGNELCLRPSHLIQGRKVGKRSPYSATKNSAPAPKNKVEFGSGPELGPWLAAGGHEGLQPGFGIPCKPALFWHRVRVSEGGCWQWYGAHSLKAGPYWWEGFPGKRPRPRICRRSVAAWAGKDGGVPWVRSFVTCGNQKCVNPFHIERGVAEPYAPRRRKRKHPVRTKKEPEYVDLGL